jgi:opine dehydrogenase
VTDRDLSGEASARIGVVGTGGVGLATAAWLAHAGHEVTVWSPGGQGANALRGQPLTATGILQADVRVGVADTARDLCANTQTLFIAVPVNGHRSVMDALLPNLVSAQTVIVSSMSSLSALYLAEAARARGLDITVAASGTTVLTARRDGPAGVRIMTLRTELGLSALPRARTDEMLALCRAYFGDRFSRQDNLLASALSNTNPAAHGPLALFNWTRIERAESWPQYHYMTPDVAAVIERLDAERLALAHAFGLTVRSIEQHLALSFNTKAERLADIATELHAKRGGPPGPTDTGTRFLHEDIPFGLVFAAALGRMAGVPMPATEAVIAIASLITGQDFAAGNDLIDPLGLAQESALGLLARVNR